MDAQAKKTALRTIPYGIYVLTTEADGAIAAATVNWVTQTSFEPPLVAVAVKADSGTYATLRRGGRFALNVLGKGQQKTAFAFFKPTKQEGRLVNGEPVRAGTTGVPVLDSAAAHIECQVRQVVELGDHHVFLGEVVGAGLPQPISGRPDTAVLEMKDLGDSVFYGG